MPRPRGRPVILEKPTAAKRRRKAGAAAVLFPSVARIVGDRMILRFEKFDIQEYETFLKAKLLPEQETVYHPEDETYSITTPSRFANLLGMSAPKPAVEDLELSDFLWQDQAEIVKLWLICKRFACWSDCGGGKTLIGLEGARHIINWTNGRGIVFTHPEIVRQWIEESEKFFGDKLPLRKLSSRADMKYWAKNGDPGLAITNYEKLNHAREGHAGQFVAEFQHLVLAIMDEGDRLNTPGGVQKWSILDSFDQTEYKLILTATPAPNDYFEFCSQAGFLNKFKSEESITSFFTRDDTSKRWKIKPHAKEAFFRFLASWSIYLRDPRRYGWHRDVPDVPPPEILLHSIEPTPEQLEVARRFVSDQSGQMYLYPHKKTNTIERAKLGQIAKGFVYHTDDERRAAERIPSLKPDFVTRIAREDAEAGLQVLVWTQFDEEAAILAELFHRARLPFETITGKTRDINRVAIMDRFRSGETRILMSRASMLGYGLNLQFAASMIFSGLTDSYKEWYQAIARLVRNGQTQTVRVHVPVVRDLEEDTVENIFRKRAYNEASIEEIERHFIKAHRLMGGAS